MVELKDGSIYIAFESKKPVKLKEGQVVFSLFFKVTETGNCSLDFKNGKANLFEIRVPSMFHGLKVEVPQIFEGGLRAK